jgi:hypothetical protein
MRGQYTQGWLIAGAGSRLTWSAASVRSRCFILILLVGMFGIVLAGCTTPYRHPRLLPVDAGFSGVADAFTSADHQAVPEVDLLLVHGMGYHDESWVQTMVGQLAPALGFAWNPGTALPPAIHIANGALLYLVTLSDSTRQLQIAAVLWSPITSSAKKTLCYDVSQPTSLCTDPAAFSKDSRARLNAYLKSQIMDDKLADVTFYLGEEGGGLIREAVEDAMLRSLSTQQIGLAQLQAGAVATAKSAPLFVISESLGSKIVVDSLQDIEDDRKAVDFARDTRSHIGALFLLANQIPILNLGARNGSGQPDPYRHLKNFARARSSQRASTGLRQQPLHVVAFSDPNDVFSYQLMADAIPREDAIISNVLVSNDCTWLGIYEDADTAHVDYIDTTPVAEAIAHGSAGLPKAVGARCAR